MKIYCYLIFFVLMPSCTKENSKNLKEVSTSVKMTRVSAEQRELIEFLMKEYFESRMYVHSKISENLADGDPRRIVWICTNFNLRDKYKPLLSNLYRQQYSKIMNTAILDACRVKKEVKTLYEVILDEFNTEYKSNYSKTLEELRDQINSNNPTSN